MPGPDQFRWYIAGVASFVVPAGIQMVLVPWLVVVHLAAGPERLGIAQMVAQLPGLLLVLLGGLLADRVDNRLILIRLHVVAALPAALLAWVAVSGSLTYTTVLCYVLAVGALTAFVQPARDAILNRIAGEALQRTVTITMGLQFGAQIIGYALAAALDVVGPAPLLATQSAMMLVGAWLAAKLAPAPPLQAPGSAGTVFGDVSEGLRRVLGSARMRAALVPLLAAGVFYGGSFVVLNPLIVREVYAGDAGAISMSYIAFMCGTILATVVLVARGGLHRQGLGLLLAMLIGAAFLALTVLVPPFAVYLLIIALWGMCGAVAMSMSRTIIQESAPATFRARALSIFSLANLGGMPIGALSMGYLAAWLGPLGAIPIAVAGVCIVCVIAAMTTPLVSLRTLTLKEREALGAV